MKQYKVHYFFQSIDDNGLPFDGVKTEKVSENNIDFYREALKGKTFGAGEYIKVYTIEEV